MPCLVIVLPANFKIGDPGSSAGLHLFVQPRDKSSAFSHLTFAFSLGRAGTNFKAINPDAARSSPKNPSSHA